MRPLHPLIIRKKNQNAVQSQTPTIQQEMKLATGYAGEGNYGKTEYLSSMIVPRTASTRDITVLETAMQGLALDDRHPIALELAATATSRHFLLRATSLLALRHLEDQVRARYPQALISSVLEPDDPLVPKDNELVCAVELRPGAAAYLPLRAWHERDLLQEGADPLLGMLAVFNHLPAHLRVVSQLALVPVPQSGRVSIAASPLSIRWSRNACGRVTR